MKRSLFSIMALLLVASLVLAACGATPEPAEAPQPTEEAQAPEATSAPEPTEVPQGEEAEPVTVDVWFHSGRAAEREALLASFGAEFEAANPDIEIELVELPEGGYNDQVQAAAIAGELPCVLDFDGPFVYNYVWGEYLIPLDDYFSQEELDDFLPSIIDQGTYQDGKLYSLGQYDSGLAIWAHKSYLEETGVRIPTIADPWDRAEFEDALAALATLEETEYAIDMKMNYAQSVPAEWLTYGYSPILQSFGADLIDRETYASAEGILNGPKAVEAMTMIQDWFEAGYANANPADDTCFTSGACALAYVGHWATAGHVDAVGDDLILLPMPDFGNGPKAGMGSWNWGITSQCANPDAAAEVLRYLVSEDSIQRMTELNGAVPARTSVFEQDERYQEGGLLYTFVQQLNGGWAVPRPVTPAYPTITAAFSVAFKNIANGADVQDELDMAVDEIEQDLEDNNYDQ
jgi:multiple sugar transport system substrate-binding protein